MNKQLLFPLILCLLFSILSQNSFAQGPSVVITSPVAPATTIFDSIPYTITFSKNVTGFIGSDIQLINGTLKHLTPSVGPASVYLAYVEPADCGPVEIKIFAGAAQDSLGQQSTAAVPLTLRFDTCRPKITFTPVNGNPTGANPVPLHIEFSEPVTGFTATDIKIDSGSISGGLTSWMSLDSLFTTAITPTGTSTIKVMVVSIDSGAVRDPANQTNDSTTIVLTYNPQFASITSYQDHPDLNVYPSPGDGNLTIHFPIATLQSWKVLNLSGQEMLKGEITTQNKIEASSLPNGTWLLMLEGENTYLVKKFTIQH